MAVGSKWRLWVPPDLGDGDEGIPPGDRAGNFVFEQMELLGIESAKRRRRSVAEAHQRGAMQRAWGLGNRGGMGDVCIDHDVRGGSGRHRRTDAKPGGNEWPSKHIRRRRRHRSPRPREHADDPRHEIRSAAAAAISPTSTWHWPIGEKQTISGPFVVAYMTERLEPKPSDRVL
jgi:hypothetical protein